MSDDEKAPVTVSTQTWRRLNALKRPGESFEDVIDRLLNDTDHDIELRE